MSRFTLIYDVNLIGEAQVNPIARTGIYRVARHLFEQFADILGTDLHGVATPPCEELLKGLWSGTPLTHRLGGSIDPCKPTVFFSAWSPVPTLVHRLSGWRACQVIYDCLPKLRPEWFSSNHIGHFDQLLQSLRPETLIFTSSENTRRDLLRLRPDLNPDRVICTALGVEHDRFRPADRLAIKRTLIRHGIPLGVPYFLCAATIEPRKNLPGVVNAFARMLQLSGDAPAYLVIVGSPGWGEAAARLANILAENPSLASRVIITGFVEDEDLVCLMSGAQAFVYLSLYEGFGLPPLEAMACGTPAIMSNRASLPEVAGRAGILVDPDDLEGVAHTMLDILGDPDRRRLLSEAAIAHAATFTWRGSAEAIIGAIERDLRG